jgi:hypothetical protein
MEGVLFVSVFVVYGRYSLYRVGGLLKVLSVSVFVVYGRRSLCIGIGVLYRFRHWHYTFIRTYNRAKAFPLKTSAYSKSVCLCYNFSRVPTIRVFA